MAWDGGAGCMGKMRSSYKFLVGTPEGKSSLVVLGVDGRIKLKKVKKW
jgi:hypothetical protein